MSLIQKILAAECLDPCGEVQFVAVFRCCSESDLHHCQSILAAVAGEIHVEADGPAHQLLFMGQVGAEIDAVLSLIGTLLDSRQDGVELMETKVVNLRQTVSVHHSFHFKQTGEPDRRTIILSPSHAFGSGDHPSTGLVIEFLEELSPLQGEVLDVGCGTGVLSLVALRLGAGKVLGLDIDEEGIRGACYNAMLNHVTEQVCFGHQPLSGVTDSFPLILANLTCSVLKYLLADITSLVSPGGTLLVSGLQGRQGVEAEVFLRDYGWYVVQRKSAGKWQALRAEKTD